MFIPKTENADTAVVLPKVINYLNLKQLVIKLGMISENAANSDSTERILLYDMWKILEGDQNEEVSLEDVKVLIMAILKTADHKRIGVSEPEGQAKTKLGFFNNKGQFCLTAEDLPIV